MISDTSIGLSSLPSCIYSNPLAFKKKNEKLEWPHWQADFSDFSFNVLS